MATTRSIHAIALIALAGLPAAAAFSQPTVVGARYGGAPWTLTGGATGPLRVDVWPRATSPVSYQVRIDFDGPFLNGTNPDAVEATLTRLNATTWSGNVAHPQFGNTTVQLSSTNVLTFQAPVPSVAGAGAVSATAAFNAFGAMNWNGGVGAAGLAAVLTRQAHSSTYSPTPLSLGLYGSAIAGLGDVNGDGAGDYVIGAAGSSSATGVQGAGRAFVISGLTHVMLYELGDIGMEIGGAFGGAVSSVPDVNSDGINDIVVGAPLQSPGTSPVNIGRAYVYSGANGTLLARLIPDQPTANAQFGWTVSGIPDINGDGRGDIIVGAPFYTPTGGPSNAGRAWVFAGGNFSGGLATRIRTVTAPTPAAGDFFGYSVSGVPDATGDNRGEYIVGCPQSVDGTVGGGAGRAFLYSGPTGALIRQINNPTAQADSQFGSTVSWTPDVNGDGVIDVLVASPFHSRPGPINRTGRVYIFSGNSGSGIRAVFSPISQEEGRFGSSLVGVPDADNDGRGDFLVGALGEPTGGGGRAYLMSGNTGNIIRSVGSLFPVLQGNFGFSVGWTTDTNADGKWDILIGAPRETAPVPGAPNRSGVGYLIRR